MKLWEALAKSNTVRRECFYDNFYIILRGNRIFSNSNIEQHDIPVGCFLADDWEPCESAKPHPAIELEQLKAMVESTSCQVGDGITNINVQQMRLLVHILEQQQAKINRSEKVLANHNARITKNEESRILGTSNPR